MKTGDKAPDVTLKDQSGKDVSLSDFKNKTVVLYFYPKDNTPGCTIEAIDFTALKKDFEKSGATILGVSKDNTKSHQSFEKKQNLTITLLSDEDTAMQKKYGVWQLKKFMGKEFMGTVRTTFVIKNGKIAKIWDKVSVKDHAKEVLDFVKTLA